MSLSVDGVVIPTKEETVVVTTHKTIDPKFHNRVSNTAALLLAKNNNGALSITEKVRIAAKNAITLELEVTRQLERLASGDSIGE